MVRPWDIPGKISINGKAISVTDFGDGSTKPTFKEKYAESLGSALTSYFVAFDSFENVLLSVPEAVLNALCKDITRERERRGIE